MKHTTASPDKPITILVVEDSRTQAEILKSTLEKHGYAVLLAENGRAGLEVLEKTRPDLIISDVVMPVMDGYEFCRTVKSNDRLRDIPLILLTMLMDNKDVIYAMVSGADNFITKPYQGDYLISRVKKILSHKPEGHSAGGTEGPAEITLSGKRYALSQDRRQIIEFLLSAYEAAVIQHQDVLVTQKRLAEANDEANLYLDIITHDIYNVNTGALALTELLLMKASPENKTVAQRLVNSINQSTEIIGNVATIRKLHEKKEALREVSLDTVIRTEIQRFSANRVEYNGTAATVMADSLLTQVFTNIIGNSIKFSGANPELFIAVNDHPDHVEVVVADNGPGITDDLKPVIFDRFRKGKHSRSGKGLGLFIARTLVERYGGTIRASDRIVDGERKGTAIHLTLKKA